MDNETRVSAAEIIERAGLDRHPIQATIVALLYGAKSMTFDDLREATCDHLNTIINAKNFTRAIMVTNERLRLINNLDPNREVCLAQIYDIMVEVDEKYFNRYVLVSN
jgi:hypothetical protein